MGDCHDCAAGNVLIAAPPSAKRKIVAIIGPPNSGKSTLFNRLTGMRQKVANFPGVTVEHRMGRVKLDPSREVFVVDLPGVYSLSPRTEDEKVTHDVLLGEMKDIARPEAILLVLDSTNLSRHLVLAAPVLSLGLPTLVILNMADDLARRSGGADAQELSEQLGTPVAMVSASKGTGLEKVFQFLDGATAAPHKAPLISLPIIQDVPKCRAWAASVSSKSGYHAPAPPMWTRRLDAIFLHPFGGPLVFALVVWGVFQSIFAFAGTKPLMKAVQAGIDNSGNWLGGFVHMEWLRSLLVDGVWAGVGSVLVFLPQILVLFLFIGILEDSGYLARAALIMDRTMARFGLQGKSFIPLLSAYACAVPAIMATRTIENKRDRIATIMIAPFMTCSARLPVYSLIIAAFIPHDKYFVHFLNAQVVAMVGLYVLGFVMAILTAWLLKSTILKSTRSPFILEMPPYRWPTLRSLGLRLLDRSKVFVRRAGTVILAVAMVIWLLSYTPFKDGKPPEIAQSFAGQIGHVIEPVIKPLGFNWKIGIGLLTSMAAREVIVGTLGIIYGVDEKSHAEGLQQALKGDLTPAGAAALLVFFAFAMQCMSTVAVVRRETGGWKWPIIQFTYMSVVAYGCAFLTNHFLSLWM
jgi:ferrous iron transport protein B